MKNVFLSVFAVVLMGMYSGSINAQSKKTEKIDSITVFYLYTAKELYAVPGFVKRVSSQVDSKYFEGFLEGNIAPSDDHRKAISSSNDDTWYYYYMIYNASKRANGGAIMAIVHMTLLEYNIPYQGGAYTIPYNGGN